MLEHTNSRQTSSNKKMLYIVQTDRQAYIYMYIYISRHLYVQKKSSYAVEKHAQSAHSIHSKQYSEVNGTKPTYLACLELVKDFFRTEEWPRELYSRNIII